MSKRAEAYHKEFDALYGGHEPNLSLSKVELAASEAAYSWQSDKEGHLTLEMFPEVFKRGFLNGYQQAEKDLGWISVKDRLPEEDGRYITCHAICGVATRVEVSLFMNGRWIASHEELDHWMEIPALPKGKK